MILYEPLPEPPRKRIWIPQDPESIRRRKERIKKPLVRCLAFLTGVSLTYTGILYVKDSINNLDGKPSVTSTNSGTGFKEIGCEIIYNDQVRSSHDPYGATKEVVNGIIENSSEDPIEINVSSAALRDATGAIISQMPPDQGPDALPYNSSDQTARVCVDVVEPEGSKLKKVAISPVFDRGKKQSVVRVYPRS